MSLVHSYHSVYLVDIYVFVQKHIFIVCHKLQGIIWSADKTELMHPLGNK